jgi:caa(3)-type oxidase subunit IV
MSHSVEHNAEHEEHAAMTKKTIWLVFWILLGLTVIDFAFYFMMEKGGFRNFIFVALGIVKSYFIVGFFMHMKYERVRLAAMIVLPMGFILALIAALLYEGGIWSITKWLE